MATYPERLVEVPPPPRGTELRVHGVSGTPPEAMLDQWPVRVAGDARSGFYRSATPGEERVEAYSWGGLTSGSRTAALWLLLLPFALANLAGWMRPGRRAGRLWTEAARAGALTVTAVAAAVLAAITMDLGAARGVLPLPGASSGVELAWATLVSAGVIALLALLARGTRPGMEEHELVDQDPFHLGSGRDPAPEATVADPESPMWRSSGLHRLLGAAHSSLALGLVALLAAAAAPSLGVDLEQREAMLVLAGLVVAIGLALPAVGTRLTGEAVVWTARAAPVVATVAVSWVTLGLAVAGGGDRVEGPLAATRLGLAVTVTAALVSVAALWLVARPRPRWWWAPGWAVLTLAVGTLLGTSAGVVATGLWLRGRLGERDPALDWMALTFLGTALVAATLFVQRYVAAPTADTVGPARGMVRAAKAVRSSPGLLALLGAIPPLVLAGLALASRWQGLPLGELVPVPDHPLVTGAGWLLLAAPLAALALNRQLEGLSGPASYAAAGIGVLAVGYLLAESAGLARTVLLVTAHLSTVVAPVLAMAVLIWQGSRSQVVRRGVGVVWDLVMFWPRWYHPWGPPPYPEVAVEDLLLRVGALGWEEPVVLSAHSQGAVLAIPVVARLPAELAGRTALLTHGTALGSFYSELFPRDFNRETLEQVAARVGGRWRNLYRITDPLGAPIPGMERSDPVSYLVVGIPRPLGHSAYRYSPEYLSERDKLLD